MEILLKTAGGTEVPIASPPQQTRAIGALLHVVVGVLTVSDNQSLRPDVVYEYDLRMTPTNPIGPPQTLAHQAGLLDGPIPLGYKAGALPTFALPPGLQHLQVIHGSCRKPHGGGPDALAIVDNFIGEGHTNQWIANTVEDARRRPHQLLLTGDQIYADDVALVLLRMLIEAGDVLLGEALKERFPKDVTMSSDVVKPGWSRAVYLLDKAELSSDHAENHLMYFAEFCAMYVLCWSDELWPRDATGAVTPGPLDLESAYGDKELLAGLPLSELKVLKKAPGVAASHQVEVLDFGRTVRQVRRVLANVPTLMMFDDHEVSDDWNIDGDWVSTSRVNPVLHQIVRNGLIAQAVFQSWGNDPSRFAAGAGKELLDLVSVPTGQIASPLAVKPAAADILLNIAPSRESLPSERVIWDWTIDGPEHRVIALDTRTHRDYGSPEGPRKPGLLTQTEMDRQLSAHKPEVDKQLLCYVIAPAPVVGHPLVEELLQPGQAGVQGNRAADQEAWCVNRRTFESFLSRLAEFGRVILLSGDVHYAYTNHTAYFGALHPRPARIVQLCSSAFKNSDVKTNAIGAAGYLSMKERGWFGFSTPIDDDAGATLKAAMMAGAAAHSVDHLVREIYVDFIMNDRLSTPPVIPAGPWFSAGATARAQGIVALARPDDWRYKVTFVRDSRPPTVRLKDARVSDSSPLPQVLKDFMSVGGVAVVGSPNVGRVLLRMTNGVLEVVHRICWWAVGEDRDVSAATYTEHVAPLTTPTDADQPVVWQ